jgi:hypothetical protein
MFSGTYRNLLVFLWCPVIENNSIWLVHQIRWFLAWKPNQSRLLELLCFLKKLDDWNSPLKKKEKIVSVNLSPAVFSLLISWPLKMGPTGWPETSVRNFHSVPCSISEEHRWWFGIVSFGVAPHFAVQIDLVQNFVCQFKINSQMCQI